MLPKPQTAGTVLDVPLAIPKGTENPVEVRNALREISVFLCAGGAWSPQLRWHTDRWLDRVLELRR